MQSEQAQVAGAQRLALLRCAMEQIELATQSSSGCSATTPAPTTATSPEDTATAGGDQGSQLLTQQYSLVGEAVVGMPMLKPPAVTGEAVVNRRLSTQLGLVGDGDGVEGQAGGMLSLGRSLSAAGQGATPITTSRQGAGSDSGLGREGVTPAGLTWATPGTGQGTGRGQGRNLSQVQRVREVAREALLAVTRR